MLTPQQIRGARAMLGLTQAEVASRAGISSVSLMKIERGLSDPRASTLQAIQRVLEASGARFIDHCGVALANGDGKAIDLGDSGRGAREPRDL